MMMQCGGRVAQYSLLTTNKAAAGGNLLVLWAETNIYTKTKGTTVPVEP